MSPAPPTLAPGTSAVGPASAASGLQRPLIGDSVGNTELRLEGAAMELDGHLQQGGDGEAARSSSGDGGASVYAVVAGAVAAMRPYAVVDEVSEGSPAATAGIQVIVSYFRRRCAAVFVHLLAGIPKLHWLQPLNKLFSHP